MVKRVLCLCFGHKLKQEIIRVSDQSVIVECVRCKNKFAYNHVERILIPYDLSMQEFYRTFNEMKKSHLTSVEPDTTGAHKADSECGAGKRVIVVA